jgi:hypothetical protein
MLFLAACAYLIHPVSRLGAVLAASLAFWFFASRYLHWTKGPTMEQLATAFGARASRPPPVVRPQRPTQEPQS